MNQSILNFLKTYSYNTWDVNRLLVSSFLILNKVTQVQNEFIDSYVISSSSLEELEQLNKFVALLEKQQISFGIEELIELFEFVISPVDKEVNGAVFTPEYIRKYIVNSTIKQYVKKGKELSLIKFGDIACGCGGFFKTITEVLRQQTDKSYQEIFKENIYGLDIEDYSIERTQILLSLLAILNKEDCIQFHFNLYHGDALAFNWQEVDSIKKNKGFDILVGNPPYVGSSKIDKKTKALLKTWSVAKSGKSDLYIPFFEIGIENLNKEGVLGFITVNTFLKSLNGRSLRNYFSSNKFDLSIIDFGGEQLFRNRSTYTCICLIGKLPSNKIKYVKKESSRINAIKKKDYLQKKYTELDNLKGWHLIQPKIQKAISKIENIGKPLGTKFLIRNGFATLKNKVYLFKPSRETKKFFYFQENEKEIKIEKEICRNAIKPNTLKLETEIKGNTEQLIFPYTIQTVENVQIKLFSNKERKLEIIDESYFKTKFPFAYAYLKSHKDSLSQRDKGTREYEKWYAFGRNQALTLYGYKLLFPYISNAPYFVFTEDKEFLFYNGYAVFSDSEEELLILQKILMSKVFWFYITNTSKPYSGGYFALAKNYIKNFGVCDLSLNEQKILLKMDNQKDIDSFLIKKYGLEIEW